MDADGSRPASSAPIGNLERQILAMGRVKARWTKSCNGLGKKIVQAMQISRAKGFFSGLGLSGAQLLSRRLDERGGRAQIVVVGCGTPSVPPVQEIWFE